MTLSSDLTFLGRNEQLTNNVRTKEIQGLRKSKGAGIGYPGVLRRGNRESFEQNLLSQEREKPVL